MASNRLAKVVITLDGSRVEVGLDKIRQKVQQLNGEMDKLAQEGKQNSKDFKDRVKAVNKLHKAESDVADVTKRINTYMKELGKVATTDLRRAYREGIQLREGFKGTDKELQKLNHDLAAMKAQIDKNTGATTAMIKAQMGFVGSLKTTLKNLVAYGGVFAIFGKIKSLLSDVIKKNLELSDQLANIRKVSGLAMNDINELTKNLAKIDTRTSIQGLNDLAYVGSKLGFGQYGIEGLEAFVKSAVKVQNALKEDMGEDAMTALSKMVEVMGLIPKMGVEKAMDATGSAIFKLASTSTATGSNIVEFSKRLMGLANQAGITTAELLAFGSASDSMALMPEVAATAFNKLITAMQKQPNLIENALQIPKGTINDLYKAGRMTDAIVTVFEKMNKVGGMNALMHAGVFKDLGSDGARLVSVMATMANRVDILNKHMATSREAFEEATAVEQEYNIQMETAQAYMERAANIWNKAFVNPEGVDAVKEFAKAWYDMTRTITESETTMKSLKLMFDLFVGSLKLLINLIPTIGFALVTRGLMSIGASFGAATIAANGFRAAWTGLSTAMKKNWISLGIGLLAQAAIYLYSLTTAVNTADDAVKNFTNDLSELNGKYEAAEDELQRYKNAIDRATEGTKERTAAINNFNKKFGGYLSNLLTEKSTALDVASAYKEVCKQLRNKLALQLREEDLNNTVKPLEQERADLGETYEETIKGTKYSQFNRSWIRGRINDYKGEGLFSSPANQRDIARDINVGMGLHLPGYIIEGIIGQVVKGNKFLQGGEFKSSGVTSGFKWQKPAMWDESKVLFSALKYIQQEGRVRTQTKKVFNKYGDVIDETIPEDNSPQTNYSDLQDAPDKAAQKAARAADAAARKELAERKQALRKELQDAETESQAIIDKIEEFYRLQESVVEGAVADGKLARADADMYLKKLKISKNEVLADVRGALTGDKEFSAENWKKYVEENLKPVMADQGKWSSELLGEIINTSLSDLHKTLNRFNGSNTFGITSTAFFDKISKGRAGNIREVNRIKAEITEEVNKMLSEYHYVEQAGKSFHDRLVALGIMTETYEEYVRRMQQEAAAAKNKGGEKKEAVDEDIWKVYDLPDVPIMGKRPPTPEEKMRSKFLSNISDAYLTNPDDEQQVLGWLKRLITTNYDESVDDWQINMEDWAEKIPHLTEWIKDFANHKSDVQLFYLDLIQWEGEYYDALKKRDEMQNKRLDSWWEHSDKKKENDKQLRNIQLYDFQYNTLKKGQGMGYMAGLTDDVNKDPEVLREQAILEAKMDIWEQAKKEREKGLISEEVYQQRMQEMQDQTIAYTQKIMANIQKRIDRLHQFEKPVTDMANNVGKKLGEMIIGAEEESMTWKEIWKSMALAVADSVIDMSAQYAQNLIVEKAMNAQSRNDAIKTASVKVPAGIASGSAVTIGQLGWWGLALIPVIAAVLHGLLAAVFSSNKSSDSTSSSSGVKTKLVSGMLTYDKGNVKRFIGQDGKVYTATEEPQPRDGLVTHPIATTVQGQPALVAEKGPEIVVGRETTKAIMMNEPQLIKYLANYEKHGGRGYMPYDSGNIADVASSLADNGLQDDNDSMRRQMQQMQEVMEQVLYYLQNPVAPEIAMYDTGGKKGLRSKMKEADRFMSRYGG